MLRSIIRIKLFTICFLIINMNTIRSETVGFNGEHGCAEKYKKLFADAIKKNEAYLASLHHNRNKERINEEYLKAEKIDSVISSEINLFVNCYAMNGDSSLTLAYFNFLIDHSNSGNETWSVCLAQMYLAKPDTIIVYLSKMPKSNREYLLQALVDGWNNFTVSYSDQYRRFQYLGKRLKKIDSILMTK